MREGREPARGRDTRHVLPSLAGAPAGKAPACGRLAALRGACLGLAGRGNGRHSRPQAAFPPRPAARECAGRRRLRRQCARRSKLRPAAAARAERPAQAGRELAARRGGRAPEGRLGASGRSPEAQAPKGRYAGRRVRRQSRAARPAPQAWPGWQGWPERRRPGRRGGRPHSPHIVGAGPPRSTNAATGAGLAGGKAREAAPQGLGLAAGLGGPAQRLAAGLA